MIKARIECYDKKGYVEAVVYLFDDRAPVIKGRLESANWAIALIKKYYAK